MSSFCVSVLVVCPDVERLLFVLELLELDVLLELLLLADEEVDELELFEDELDVELDVEVPFERELKVLDKLDEERELELLAKVLEDLVFVLLEDLELELLWDLELELL